MTPASSLRKRDPYRLDAIVRYSGDAYRRAGKLGKHVAGAHDVDDSRGRSYRRGDISAPVTKALLALASYPKTTAWSALTEAIIIVHRADIEAAPTATLIERRAELEGQEADANRDVFHARMSGTGMRETRARQMDIVQELLAIESELDERARRKK